MFAGDQEQDVEGHRGPARHRRLLVRRLYAPQTLYQESVSVRVSLRPRWHRPSTYHQPS